MPQRQRPCSGAQRRKPVQCWSLAASAPPQRRKVPRATARQWCSQSSRDRGRPPWRKEGAPSRGAGQAPASPAAGPA
eukprot:10341375-Alexandrium_andersonii.AAC.1